MGQQVENLYHSVVDGFKLREQQSIFDAGFDHFHYLFQQRLFLFLQNFNSQSKFLDGSHLAFALNPNLFGNIELVAGRKQLRFEGLLRNHSLLDALKFGGQIQDGWRDSIFIQDLLALIPSHIADYSGLELGVFTSLVPFFF